MNSDKTRYYVRLAPDDRRYWHWWLARRDRLDVFHLGAWYELLAWKELIEGERPYPVEATLAPRVRTRLRAGEPAVARPGRGRPLRKVAAPRTLSRRVARRSSRSTNGDAAACDGD